MGKRKTSKQNPSNNNKFLVITKYPEDYKMFDLRANKPICFKDSPITGGDASMVLQEMDTLELPLKSNGKNDKVNYFAPNNVGLLLSISNKSSQAAKKILYGQICSPSSSSEDKDYGKGAVIKQSQLIYDYIEMVQSSIVFGYTALEAFTNLSVPSDYEYKAEPNGKGIIEVYNKQAVERWTTLKVKISEILVNVYRTKTIKGLKIWSDFLLFEDMRHEIIHQKSIDHTSFYKKYFKKNLFEICSTPEEIIRFFFDNREDKSTTNPLWPWIINGKNEFPVSYNHKSENFEVIGNVFEGIKG